MFDKLNIGSAAKNLKTADALAGYSRVTIQVSDDVSYTAGTDTGKELVLENPFGTQKMANDILAKVKGYSYQPYTAAGAIWNPAAELGDAIQIKGTYGGIYNLSKTFGKDMVADVSAPGSEEIDESFPYKSHETRKIERQWKETKSSLQVLTDKIALEVSAREEQGRQLAASITVQADRITQEVTDRTNATNALSSQITQQAGEIAAKVSKTGGSNSSFGWNMTETAMTWYANRAQVMKIDKSGASIKGRIDALTGKIGGFDIQADYLSYNNQTWGGTNSYGIYLGTQGIQCGSASRGVQITPDGWLYAEHGEFRGSVQAGMIAYGGDDGTLDGDGITSDSISGGWGGQISGGSIGNYAISDGIATSLGYADFANGVFNGWNEADDLHATSLKLDGHYLNRASIQIGNSRYKLVTWI